MILLYIFDGRNFSKIFDTKEIEIAMMYYFINAKIVRLHGYIFHEYDWIQVLTNSLSL